MADFLIGSETFGEAAGFDEFEDDTQQNTTSNDWVTAVTFTSIDELGADEARPSGRYVLICSVNLGQSDKEKRVGFRVQHRSGTSGPWETVFPLEVEETVGFDESFKLVTGMGLFEHVIETDEIQTRIQFGQTNDGGTGRIKNKKLITWKVSDL